MTTVFWNTFEPALTNDNWSTSAGGGTWTTELWDYFDKHGIEMVNVSVGLDGVDLGAERIWGPKPDLIVLCWRWAMPGYPDRHRAYERQQTLLQLAASERIPVLIHNQDLQGDLRDPVVATRLLRLENVPYLLTMPAMFPPNGYRQLHFPAFHGGERLQTQLNYGSRSFMRVYIGNNYERYAQSVEWYGNIVANIWGNWMEPGQGREKPERVLKDFGPGVKFHGRLDQHLVPQILNDSVATVHLSKELYMKYGMMTYRWAEAAKAGVYAFVPGKTKMPREGLDAFSDNLAYWRESFGQSKLRYLAMQQVAQQQFVIERMRFEPWLQAVQELLG